MVRCSVCNQDNADGAQFCTNCGHKLESVQDVPTEEAGTEDGPEGVNPSSKGASVLRKSVVIGVASLVVLLCIAFFGAGWLFGRLGSFSLDEIPDEAFRSYLGEMVDTDGDGRISEEESELVTQMGTADGGDVKGNGLAELGISDLTGIEHFENLDTIVCSNNSIPKIDFSQNTKLKTVVCNNSQVEELVLPQTDTLQNLQATGNNMTEIDISGNEGLVDIGLDPDVDITGSAVGEDADLSGLKDLALLYAASLEMLQPDEPIPSKVEPGQSAELDGYLIWSAVRPIHLEGEGMGAGGNAYGFASVPVEGYSTAVGDDTGRAVLSAVYGWSPDDMSYIDSSHYVLDRVDDGWRFDQLDDPFIGSAELKNVATSGKLVFFDVTFVARQNVAINPTCPSIYRMVAVQDDASPFGYHLIACQEISTKTVSAEVVEDASVEDMFCVRADHLEFTVPAYWRGRVRWEVTGDTIVIFSSSYQNRQIASIRLGKTGPYGGGSVDTATLCSVPFTLDLDLIVIGPLYSYIIPASRMSNSSGAFDSYSDEEARELIDLQTGGIFSFEELCETFSPTGDQPDTNGWIQETIPSCVSVISTEGLEAGDEEEEAAGKAEETGAAEEPEAPVVDDSDAGSGSGNTDDVEPSDQQEASQGQAVSEEAFVARAREALKVPDGSDITYSIGEPSVWGGTGTTIINIAFYRGEELIASAGCTADGNPATSILVYNGG